MPELIQPQVTYPGVYVVELPAGSHGIPGVPTSITAFVGRTAMGPENTALPITSFGDFEQLFGGLSEAYTLPWAVRDFFANGGAQAVVVRLVSIPPVPAPDPFEAGGAAFVLDAILTNMASMDAKTIETTKLALPTAVTSTAAKTAAASVTKAFTDAVTAGNLGKATGDALMPAVLQTALRYVTLLTDWTAPSTVTSLPETGLAGLAASAVVVASDLTTAPTSPPNLTTDFLDSLLAAWLTVRGPFAAQAPLYGALDLGTNTTIGATLAAGADLVAAVWAMYGNKLASPGAADLLAAAQTAYDPMAGAQRTALKPMLVAIRTAAGKSGATADSVADATLKGWIALVPTGGASPLSVSDLLYLGLSGCADLPAVIELGTPLAAAIDKAFSPKKATATPALTAALGTEPATPQDVLDALLAGVGTQPVLTLVANGSGTWADGGALSVAVAASTASPQLLASLKLKDSSSLFDLTVTYQAAGSPLATTNTYPNVTLVQGTPNTLDTVLLDDPYVRVGSVPDRTKTPAPCGPVSFAGGQDSPPLGQLDYQGDEDQRTGLFALLEVDIFNLLCLPWDVRDVDTPVPVYQNALSFCAANKAVLLVDPPKGWAGSVKSGTIVNDVNNFVGQLGGGITARNGAIWFPRLLEVDPLTNLTQPYPPCGAIAGVIAATDASRGVWKAPAGTNAGLQQIAGFEVNLNDAQNGLLNPLGVNCFRTFTGYGPVSWGDRTLRGATAIDDEYMYLSVRRLALYLEASLQRGLKWAVFEPNDESLWSSIRASVTAFMAGLKSQGAFYSFAVTCDATTTTQEDIDAGIVNVLIQFAPVKPAEFVVLYFQQVAGQTAS